MKVVSSLLLGCLAIVSLLPACTTKNEVVTMQPSSAGHQGTTRSTTSSGATRTTTSTASTTTTQTAKKSKSSPGPSPFFMDVVNSYDDQKVQDRREQGR